MNKLYLYAIFHANLNFSCVPKEFYPQIIRNCYWPLLRIIEEQDSPLGLEFSAHTLRIVDSLDHSFVVRLRELWEAGKCEVVGSGYVQSIMPLIPAKVNRENLRLGKLAYEELIGKQPGLAYVNEQVYSAGLPSLYREVGYQSMLVNWESSEQAEFDSELLYRPCSVPLDGDEPMPVIWHSILAYRNFQRYVEGEITSEEYLAFLQSHIPSTGERAFPLYGSDWEVFDFKPWRSQPDDFFQAPFGEMERISNLLATLKKQAEFELVTPSSILSRFQDLPTASISNADHPLTYKKQDAHSMARWAVGGRDGVKLNTQCHQLYQDLLFIDWSISQNEQNPDAGRMKTEAADLWQDLCLLWNSDLRTFTTEDKHVESRNRMGAALYRASQLKESLRPQTVDSGNVWLVNCSSVAANAELASFTVHANGVSDGLEHAYSLQVNDVEVPCQVTSAIATDPNVTMTALLPLPAANAAIGTIKEQPSPAISILASYSIDQRRHVIETAAVRLVLSSRHGGSILSLAFPSLSEEPFISQPSGTTPHSVFYADNGFSGDVVVQNRYGKRVTDHSSIDIQYPGSEDTHDIFLPVRCKIRTDIGTVWKTYRVYLNQPRVDLSIRFQWADVVPDSFRIGRMIVNPAAFDRESLYYATTNGGEMIERFPLSGKSVRQDEPADSGITNRGCLGATEGWLVMGDANKGLGFITRQADQYSVPLIHYEESALDPDRFLLSMVHTMVEGDDTTNTMWRGHSTWNLSILGGAENLIETTRTSAIMANGGLIASSNAGYYTS